MTTWLEARLARQQRIQREHRHYSAANLGRPCPDCGQRLPFALNAAGITHHPTCGPDARQLLERQP